MAREVNEKLPLAGIRVLDMTRVLAGVGVYYIGS
jgi:crotonobetainyl-CoA:carnitine CoA-transferase CaiB-like acyl-CoA transferase